MNEGPMLETLDHTFRIGSTPTFLYFDFYRREIYRREILEGDIAGRYSREIYNKEIYRREI